MGALPPNPRDLSLWGQQGQLGATVKIAPSLSALGSALRVAVGMTITDHPPHRSVRAELPHTAPPLDTSVETDIGIWMKSAGTRNPPIEDRPQTIPVWLTPLTAPA